MFSYLAVLSGAAFVLALVLGLAALIYRRKVLRLDAEMRAAEADKQSALSDLAVSENRIQQTLQHNGELANQLQNQRERIEQVLGDCARLDAEKNALLRNLEEQKKFVSESTQQMENSFRSLAARALEGNNQQFIDLAKQILAKESGSYLADMEKRDQGFRLLLDPLKDSLSKYQSFAQQMEVERQKAYTSIESELKRITDTSSSLVQTTAALKDALKKPHV
ncbi:MAG: hypothetical protein KDD43_06320, partial [Bdellovibrionales bacterium]|nr:hypothetical protein [Bdellovibrionales bacterium]